MPGSRSAMFEVGLAACGCFIAFPGVPWFWPFGDPYAWGSLPPLTATFAACYLLVRGVDGLASRLEAELGRIVRRSGSPHAAADPARDIGSCDS